MANLVSSRKHSRLNKQNSFLSSTLEPNLEICLLSNNIMDYHIVSQGKTTIPGLDDGEEGQLTDVRHRYDVWYHLTLALFFTLILCRFLIIETISRYLQPPAGIRIANLHTVDSIPFSWLFFGFLGEFLKIYLVCFRLFDRRVSFSNPFSLNTTQKHTHKTIHNKANVCSPTTSWTTILCLRARLQSLVLMTERKC
jgi:hypothetical protein